MNRDVRIFVVVVAGVVIFIAGFASYALVFPSHGGSVDAVSLYGYVTVKAYHSDGLLYATWQGHNSLYPQAINLIAVCLSGNSSTPYEYNTCVGPARQVSVVEEINGQGYFEYGQGTTSMLPVGCLVVGNPPNCDGWKIEGVITFSSGGTVTEAGAINQGVGTPFDDVNLSPTIAVNPGDMVVVSISFTIT